MFVPFFPLSLSLADNNFLKLQQLYNPLCCIFSAENNSKSCYACFPLENLVCVLRTAPFCAKQPLL